MLKSEKFKSYWEHDPLHAKITYGMFLFLAFGALNVIGALAWLAGVHYYKTKKLNHNVTWKQLIGHKNEWMFWGPIILGVIFGGYWLITLL